MKKIITIMKLLSIVSFLLILPPAEVVSVPFWALLVVGLYGAGGVWLFCIAALTLTCITWILFTVLYHSMEMDVSSLMVLLLFLVPIAPGAREALMENFDATFKTYIAFIIVDISTVILLLVRIFSNDYTDTRTISQTISKKYRKSL